MVALITLANGLVCGIVPSPPAGLDRAEVVELVETIMEARFEVTPEPRPELPPILGQPSDISSTLLVLNVTPVLYVLFEERQGP